MGLFEFNSKDQAKIREKFDWISVEETYSFFKYKGELMHLSEFVTTNLYCPTELRGWDGYLTDSYFSGIAIRLAEGNEEVIVGTFFS